jgi:site-specific DNA-cytosine methylase
VFWAGIVAGGALCPVLDFLVGSCMKIAFKPVLTVEVEVPRLSSRKRLQAGHELLFLCESDPGARQVRIFSPAYQPVTHQASPRAGTAGHRLCSLTDGSGLLQVLKQQFPGVTLAHDVCAISSLPPSTELLVAGFPCVDVSRAGLRAGITGSSTGLVKHVFRLLATANASNEPIPWVLLENVEALLDRIDDQPPPAAFIIQQLEQLGYHSWAYRVINSAGFGVPMRRRRIFIVASMHGDARDVLLTQGMQQCVGACRQLFDNTPCYSCHTFESQTRTSNKDVNFAVDLGQAMAKPAEDVVPSLTTSNDRILLLLRDGRVGMLRVEDAERIQGLPEGWTKGVYPVTGEGVHGHRRQWGRETDVDAQSSKRWQLLGNAVTVDVGRWLGERLMNPYSYKYRNAQGAFRMDNLVYEGRRDELRHSDVDTAGDGRKRNGEMGYVRSNVWSFVTVDEIQEAAIFSFKDSSEYKRARISEINQGVGGEKGQEGLAASQEIRQEAAGGDEHPGVHGEGNTDEANEMDKVDVESHDLLSAAEIATPVKTQDAPSVSRMQSSLDAHGENGLQEVKDRFQAKMYGKIKKGLIQSSPLNKKDKPLASDKTWPKCAWGQKGMGRFGVTRWHDHPVLCPFQSLDSYITQIGRSPTQEERAGYVHRLKEKGWDICEEVLGRISGTHKLASKSMDVTRIEGLLSDADMVGELVWAPWKESSRDGREGGEIYWPGEVLDPINMPIGRNLPKNALDHLSSDEKRASTISLNHAWNHEDYIDSEHKRVLVMFFPVNNGKWQWYPPKALLPWMENRPVYEKMAHEVIRKPGFSRGDVLEHALQDAAASYGVKHNKSSIITDKMRQTRAAAASAMVDLKQRCGRCRTCMNAYAGTKRYDCLTQRMTASALGGHAGAQLSMCGEAAIGARVAVWWDGDEEYFEGTICWYDPVSTEHTVAYDDGEIGMHRLWQHDEHIVIKSDVCDWKQDAKAVRERLKQAIQKPLTELASSEDIENNKRASELASRMPELTKYELEREDNLQVIKSKFKLFLGL